MAYYKATWRQISFFGWDQTMWLSWQSYSMKQCQIVIDAR